MGEIVLKKYCGSDQLAAAVAQEFVQKASYEVRAKSQFSVALAGGRIAAVYLREIARLGASNLGILQATDYFWSDERVVPPGNPESNYRLAQENLLKSLEIPLDRVHRIRTELPDHGVAAATELVNKLPQSQLDLVLLGMGEDGHIASIFPSTPKDWVRRGSFVLVSSPKPPPLRVSMTYPVIKNAKAVWVVVSGLGKAAALRSSMEGNANLPLGELIRSREVTFLFIDEENI